MKELINAASIALGVFVGLAAWSLIFDAPSRTKDKAPWAGQDMSAQTSTIPDAGFYWHPDEINQPNAAAKETATLSDKPCGQASNPCHIRVSGDELSVYITNPALPILNH